MQLRALLSAQGPRLCICCAFADCISGSQVLGPAAVRLPAGKEFLAQAYMENLEGTEKDSLIPFQAQRCELLCLAKLERGKRGMIMIFHVISFCYL